MAAIGDDGDRLPQANSFDGVQQKKREKTRIKQRTWTKRVVVGRKWRRARAVARLNAEQYTKKKKVTRMEYNNPECVFDCVHLI